MSSNNSNHLPDFDPKIKVKSEPGARSPQALSSSTSVTSALLTNIKTEPEVISTTQATRLPSFRVPRDLTLGGNIKLEKAKKVYTPNLNVQRTRNREEANVNSKNESGAKSNRRQREKDGKYDKNKDKNKGKPKNTNNLVQSSGIFSDGLANLSTKRSSGGSGFRSRDSLNSDRETAAPLERPKLSIPQKVDKAEEAEKLKELLRDNFIDDGIDMEIENSPVTLPMINQSKVFKTENSLGFNKSNGLHENTFHLQNGKPMKEDKNVNFDQKPVKTEETELPHTISQIIDNKQTASFILMQLPDCLPGLLNDNNPNESKQNQVPDVNTESETSKNNKFCTLNNLKEGILGTLQILKSGKARMVLGDNNLIVDIGSTLSFRQDLVAAKISDDRQHGDLIHLGSVNSTLICSPDWESMLNKLN